MTMSKTDMLELVAVHALIVSGERDPENIWHQSQAIANRPDVTLLDSTHGVEQPPEEATGKTPNKVEKPAAKKVEKPAAKKVEKPAAKKVEKVEAPVEKKGVLATIGSLLTHRTHDYQAEWKMGTKRGKKRGSRPVERLEYWVNGEMLGYLIEDGSPQSGGYRVKWWRMRSTKLGSKWDIPKGTRGNSPKMEGIAQCVESAQAAIKKCWNVDPAEITEREAA